MTMHGNLVSMDLQAAQRISSVFLQASQAVRDRVKKAAADRVAVLAAQESGKTPEGARSEWMRQSVVEVVRLLGKQADTFNNGQQEIRIGIVDLVDVLGSATAFMKKKAAK